MCKYKMKMRLCISCFDFITKQVAHRTTIVYRTATHFNRKLVRDFLFEMFG